MSTLCNRLTTFTVFFLGIDDHGQAALHLQLIKLAIFDAMDGVPVWFDFRQNSYPVEEYQYLRYQTSPPNIILCFLSFFHLMEYYPARTRFSGKEDRGWMNMQDLSQ